MNVLFHQSALADYQRWAAEDKKIFDKINTLLNEIMHDPFRGTGKPEPLKHDMAGYWSRRINHRNLFREHRLVYTVSGELITVISCKFHYKK
ncbi:toxin YoeB [Spirochaetia bacterium]|nr:toxin YoeB [Spirochaetia bacterium]